MNNEFKAGDFTSGKMGEIFRHCFTSRDTTIINHKQHGALAMIPDVYIAFMVNRALHKNDHFNDFLKSEYPDESFDNDMPIRLDIVCDYLCADSEGFDWMGAMVGLLLCWSEKND